MLSADTECDHIDDQHGEPHNAFIPTQDVSELQTSDEGGLYHDSTLIPQNDTFFQSSETSDHLMYIGTHTKRNHGNDHDSYTRRS